ncbi:uroporphyrinogen-III synthase [Pullulanibacillus pueri]|uniref:Tetrapyrrole biosynthesis uroporphyrinogen III synthase domain-containing protein n=1 Tax=Pullulanibacillus pueri TaxID=1437324 RepID=A0A8J2ZZH2_9BACL|nr:uroporphyrinogen-III synthase [Pullulanibacillus pueri]MBM7684040.1 uroporphyrinogen-III synthase [Pullulanibacillus pueri]GGH88483.1 hypothetical protein GCM10007096_40920 [Pullulanibacillus pueri]
MKGLTGKHIGIAADRQAEAISTLIQKQGGIAVSKPIQGEKWLDEKSAAYDVARFLNHPFDWALFTTGIGAEALEKAAQSIHRLDDYIDKLSKTSLAIRGTKTQDWLKKWGLEPTILSPNGTMHTLIQLLDAHPTTKQALFYQSYDQEERQLVQALNQLSMDVYHSEPYHYFPPDRAIVEALRFGITSQSLDAVVFTSKTQVENLFRDAGASQGKLLYQAFETHVLAVAVGQVTAEALHNHGISKVLQPERAKMGAMIIALAQHFSNEHHD